MNPVHTLVGALVMTETPFRSGRTGIRSHVGHGLADEI